MPRPSSFTADELAERALMQFWMYGFNATSMDALVQTTGVSRHGIYNTFGDKHGLYQACFSKYQDLIVTPAFSVVEQPGANLESVALYFETQIAAAETAGLPGLGCFVANSATEVAPHDADTLARVAEHNDRLRAGFRIAIANAANANMSRQEMDHLVEVCVMFTNGLWSTSRTVSEGNRLRQSANLFVQMLRDQLSWHQTCHFPDQGPQTMSKTLSGFAPLSGFDSIYHAQKGELRCSAIRLSTGGICLYSPVLGLGPDAVDSLNKLGEVTHLLAPNHYHHKGLSQYADRFPKATLCCTNAARPRLQKQTGVNFSTLDEAGLRLPKGARFLHPDGLKTGEVWIDVSTSSDRVWIVTDAFRGAKASDGFSDRLELLGTFPSYGIANLQQYHQYVTHVSQAASPTVLVPCHGSIVSNDNLSSDIARLVTDLL